VYKREDKTHKNVSSCLLLLIEKGMQVLLKQNPKIRRIFLETQAVCSPQANQARTYIEKSGAINLKRLMFLVIAHQLSVNQGSE